jgi:PKD repeat protein
MRCDLELGLSSMICFLGVITIGLIGPAEIVQATDLGRPFNQRALNARESAAGVEKVAPHDPYHQESQGRVKAAGIQDGGFELGSPNPYWTESSTNGYQLICSPASCGSARARTGSYWAWLGGGEAEVSTVEQELGPSAGQVRFYLWIEPGASPSDSYLNVSIDGGGGGPGFYFATQPIFHGGYQEVVMEVTAQAGTGPRWVRFTGVSAINTNIYLDDISFTPTEDCEPSIAPWHVATFANSVEYYCHEYTTPIPSGAPISLVWEPTYEATAQSYYEWEVHRSYGYCFGFNMNSTTLVDSGQVPYSGMSFTQADIGPLGDGYYCWQVKLVIPGNPPVESCWSEDGCGFKVGDCHIEAPVDLAIRDHNYMRHTCAAAIENTAPIQLEWDDVPGVNGYEIDVRHGSCDGDVYLNTLVTTPGWQFSGPLALGDYCWKTRAYNEPDGRANGCWSDCCCFTAANSCVTLDTPVITGVGGSTCGGSTVQSAPRLTWTDVPNASGYQWEVRDLFNFTVESGETAQNVTAASVPNLPPGSYGAYVRALGDAVDFCDGNWTARCSFTVEEVSGEAAFIWWPTRPKVGQRVRFADVTEGQTTSWDWDFGDGGTSASRNPYHAFAQAGTYSVTLAVDTASGPGTVTENVTVVGEIICGDGVCEGRETAWSCRADCGLDPGESGRAGSSSRRPSVAGAASGEGGSSGSFWNTEGAVYNPGPDNATVLVEYTPRGQSEVFQAGPFELEPQRSLRRQHHQ